MSRVVIGWAAALALSTSAAGCKKSEEPAPANATGNTPCETSYSTLEGIAKASAPAGEQKRLMPKDQFLASCKELPPQLQKCLVLGYAMEHGDTCQEARNKLDPAGQERLRKLMSGE
jgi:hypothetical protein